MNLAQSPHVPAQGSKPRLADLPWLISYGLHGLARLVIARLKFETLTAKEIPQRNQDAKINALDASILDPAALARISYVMPRISDRLPWRSDCLVQAIAAQDWLSNLGAASEIQIGVEHPEGGKFAAHAWLMHEGQIVTGGDISQYDVILADSQSNNDSGD